ncbi:MAG TPA: RodZ domain-containing protein [Paenibacillus cookii]|nr:RodZ domain-containing protein [Paenibacillus cookii]
MSELGQQLREARLQKGMSLDDVQEMTKIRKRYLEAIEAGDYKVLPGSFYVRAFIKTYAETVGLDPDLLLEGHKQEAPAEPEPVMEPVIQKRSSTRSSERNVKWLSTTLMWIFPILIIVVIYWYASSATQPKSNGVDPAKVTQNQQDPSKNEAANTTTTPPAGQDKAGENKDNTPQGQNETGGGMAGGNQQTTPPENGTGTTTDNGNTSTDNGGNTSTDNGNATTDNGGTTTDNGTVTPPGNQAVTVEKDRKRGKDTIFKVAAPAGAPVTVEIKASGESWVEVYRGQNIHGEKLSFGKTKSGESMSFTLDSAGLYIKSGYSPATTITVGGQTVTDGKSVSRILLNLVDSGTVNTTGDQSSGSNTGNAADGGDSNSASGND